MERGFRDTKDLRFGMGLKATHIKNPARRDRLLLRNALAIVLLTLLGVAGESLGMDRHLRANTVKYRMHSLFRHALPTSSPTCAPSASNPSCNGSPNYCANIEPSGMFSASYECMSV